VKVILRLLTPAIFLCLVHAFTLAQTPTPTPTDEAAVIQSSNLLNAAVGIVRGVSDDGRRVVLESTEDLTAVRDLTGNVITGMAGTNTDRNREIFVYDTVARTFIQITNTQNVTTTSTTGTVTININVSNNAPVISGDGTRIAFSSNSGTLDGANPDGNQEIFIATLPAGSTTPTFRRVTTTGLAGSTGIREFFDNYAPTINSDGSRVAFVSTRDNADGLTGVSNNDRNGEIILFNASTGAFTQVTNKVDSDAQVGFNFLGFNSNPSLSGNGTRLAFLSGFNYAASGATVNNSDFNGEVFIYNVTTGSITQVTNTKAEDIAFPTSSPVNVLSTGTRHLNNDGTLLVFESSADLGGLNADKTREVFLYRVDSASNQFTRITNQTLAANPTAADLAKIDFNFSPGITADGTQVFFASIQNLVPVSSGSSPRTDNADGSRDVFRYGPIAANGQPAMDARFRQITFTGLSNLVLDQREAVVLANTNADGTRVALSSNSDIIGTNPDTSQELFQVVVRPVTGANTPDAVLTNGASFANASAATNPAQVGRGSIVTAFGSNLASVTATTQRADFDFLLGGVSVTVSNAAAHLIYVSPGQINFVLPQGAQTGDAVEFSINNNGVVTKGKAKIADAGPGIFSVNGNGVGAAAATCQSVTTATPPVATFSLPPCAVGTAEVRQFLNFYGTGFRNAAAGTLSVIVGTGDTARTFTPQFAGAQTNVYNVLPGLDQLNLELPADFPKGTNKAKIRFTSGTTTVDSNEVEITVQ
jgi:uncharacterized protein (TIGR03437 family)